MAVPYAPNLYGTADVEFVSAGARAAVDLDVVRLTGDPGPAHVDGYRTGLSKLADRPHITVDVDHGVTGAVAVGLAGLGVNPCDGLCSCPHGDGGVSVAVQLGVATIQ
jgi:hypothetical protein